MATRTGLLLTKTVRGYNARSLEKSMAPRRSEELATIQDAISKTWRFLTSILENKDSMDRLRRLVCLFAEEYSQLFLEFFRPSI